MSPPSEFERSESAGISASDIIPFLVKISSSVMADFFNERSEFLKIATPLNPAPRESAFGGLFNGVMFGSRSFDIQRLNPETAGRAIILYQIHPKLALLARRSACLTRSLWPLAW